MDDLILDQNGRTLTGNCKILQPRGAGRRGHIEWDLLHYRIFRLYVEKDGEVIGLEMLNEGKDSDYLEIYKPDQQVMEEMCRRIEQFGLRRDPDVLSEDGVPGELGSSITSCVLAFIGFAIFVFIAAFLLNWLEPLAR